MKEKRRTYKIWQGTQSEEDRREYKEKARQAKRAVARAKRLAWEGWGQELNSNEKQLELFKIAKQMKRERKDIVGAKYVKDEEGNIQTQREDILRRWKEYFENLLNEESECSLEEIEVVEGPIDQITEGEVKRALKGMKSGKSPGPTGLSSDLIRNANVVEETTRIFRDIVDRGEIPEEWKDSETVPIYKGKGDALECGKYRGIRLLEHGMKLFERVLENRLRKLIKVDCRQFGFSPGRSTTDAIFIVRQMQEKYSERKKKLYHVFVDLEKAFDRVPRAAIEWALRRQKVPEKLVTVIMALYQESRSKVRTMVGTSEAFDIRVGVHQGSSLSPLLFITVMEEAAKTARGEGPWELLYADDLVLTAETKEEVTRMFNKWKEQMELRGLKVNLEKTKSMVTGKRAAEAVQSGRWPCGCCGRGVGSNSVLCVECNKWCHQRCSGLRNLRGVRNFVCPRCAREETAENEERAGLEVNGGTLEEVQQFCYLGDVLDCEAGVERAVRARVATSWKKWREMASLLVNRHIGLRTRGRIYEACIRSAMLYGSETWALTDRLKEVLCSSDRRMLRYMVGVRWQESRSNQEVADMCGLEDLSAKLRKRRLTWFGHVKRAEGGLLLEVEEMRVEGRRPVGRPKKRWKDCVTEDMNFLGIDERVIQDRQRWKAAMVQLYFE